jgi:hypothetical protein
MLNCFNFIAIGGKWFNRVAIILCFYTALGRLLSVSLCRGQAVIKILAVMRPCWQKLLGGKDNLFLYAK